MFQDKLEKSKMMLNSNDSSIIEEGKETEERMSEIENLKFIKRNTKSRIFEKSMTASNVLNLVSQHSVSSARPKEYVAELLTYQRPKVI